MILLPVQYAQALMSDPYVHTRLFLGAIAAQGRPYAIMIVPLRTRMHEHVSGVKQTINLDFDGKSRANLNSTCKKYISSYACTTQITHTQLSNVTLITTRYRRHILYVILQFNNLSRVSVFFQW